ncbi:MAG: 30S ribosomal protein S20 [Bradymonadia bacterium]
MANTKQTIKRIRQNEKARIRNRHIRSTFRTYTKRVRSAVESGNLAAAEESLKLAVTALTRAASKGVIHRNNAARSVSRLTKAVNALRAQA